MQWLQNPESSLDNLNNARCKASRHFRNKNREYLKVKINELETKTVRIRIAENCIDESATLRRPTILDLIAGFNSNLARWNNYFSRLLNVHRGNDVRQTEIHTAEPTVPEPSAVEVEMTVEKRKRHKSPGIDQIPAELIKAGSSKICSETH